MKQQKSKKVRAILAGGLVLGVGAAVTLAAWNDSEFAKETFTAGSFNLEGSTVEVGPYTDQAMRGGEPLDLNFSEELFSNLAPGDTAYAPYWLRLDSNSTIDGSLTPSGVVIPDVAEPNADAISYRITKITEGETCGKGEAEEIPIASGKDLNTQPVAPTTIPLIANAPEIDGTPVGLCISVTAGAEDTFDQGVTTTAVWRFDAVPRDAR